MGVEVLTVNRTGRNLTQEQKRARRGEIVVFIHDQWEAHLMGPSLSDIAAHFGMVPTNIKPFVDELVRSGELVDMIVFNNIHVYRLNSMRVVHP